MVTDNASYKNKIQRESDANHYTYVLFFFVVFLLEHYKVKLFKISYNICHLYVTLVLFLLLDEMTIKRRGDQKMPAKQENKSQTMKMQYYNGRQIRRNQGETANKKRSLKGN